MDLDEINLVSNKRLHSISLIYNYLLSLKAPDNLVIAESPNPFHKIISSAFLSKGSDVRNFSHGNDLGFVHQKWTQTYFYAQAGNYGFENNKICKIFKEEALKLPLASKEKPIFFSVNTNIGLRRNNITYPVIRKSEIKKVMLVGYPMNSTRYTDDVYCFFYYAFKLQVHILKQLKQLGYYTIYKTHPDRLLEIGDLMNNFADECDSNKFEKVWHKTDAIIFTHCTTTTFGYAITTNLPIVLISETSTDWNYQRKLQIQKRIHLLDYAYNNNKFTGLNSTNLNKALLFSKNKIPLDKIKEF